MLLSNLLSNYLPDPDDPRYPGKLASYPSYRELIEKRYPAVCEDCLPAVEEEIRKRDNMARTRALGGFLKDTRGMDKHRRVEATQAEKENFEKSLFVWRIRGLLWLVTLLESLISHTAVAAGYPLPRIPASALPFIPIFVILSLGWTAWDPTYAIVKRGQLQGRVVRQKGKKEYNILQSIAWISRLAVSIILALPRFSPSWGRPYLQEPIPTQTRIFSSFFCSLELLILIRSIVVLRVQRPPPVQLRDDSSRKPLRAGLSPTPSSSRSATPVASSFETDALGPLSISTKHNLAGPSKIPTTHPIFGLPSFPDLNASSSKTNPQGQGQLNRDAMDEDEDVDNESQSEKEEDPDAMDWTPTSTPAKLDRKGKGKGKGKGKARANIVDDGSWLRPQRFFPPEEPTGLENLFEKTIKLADDERPNGATVRKGRRIGWKHSRGQVWIFVCAVVLSVLVSLVAWGYFSWQKKGSSLLSTVGIELDPS
ncbi:unnamed protein product [Somion occarium]